ncbi:alanine racemase [bacterium]|nr:alanine racemase [bacterium]
MENILFSVAEIDISALLFNFGEIKKKVSPVKVMAVLKSNAYGHGLEVVSRELEKNGADYFGVFNLKEGLTIRKAGVKTPVLMFLPLFGDNIITAVENDLEMAVVSVDSAKGISENAGKTGKKAKVHIKIDTGMTRLGVDWEDAADTIREITGLPYIEITGIYTHYATSDTWDKEYAGIQLERFKQVVTELESNNINIPLKHTANSGATLDMEDAYFDMVRPGIILYGYYPSGDVSRSIELKPVMTLKSKVVQMRYIKKGTTVGYTRSFTADDDTVIAVVPIGYAHGYRRTLSNNMDVLIGGRRYPIAGNVSMEYIMVNIGNDNEIQTGDEVVIFGKQGSQVIDLWEICDKCDTIPNELVTQVAYSVPKVYVNL